MKVIQSIIALNESNKNIRNTLYKHDVEDHYFLYYSVTVLIQ